MALQDTHPNSRKVYVGSIKVPVREVALSGGEPPLQLYDTSGPEGHDVREGLPPLTSGMLISIPSRPARRSGGIGRRARFRAVFASVSVGSTPTSGIWVVSLLCRSHFARTRVGSHSVANRSLFILPRKPFVQNLANLSSYL